MYDFEKNIEKAEKKQSTIIRKNFRIVKCCGNCHFFCYQKAKERRGYCRLGSPRRRNYWKNKKIPKDWHRTHTTNLCDSHKYSGRYHSITRVEEWVKAKFEIDGGLIEYVGEKNE